jgi:hypothetical protein
VAFEQTICWKPPNEKKGTKKKKKNTQARFAEKYNIEKTLHTTSNWFWGGGIREIERESVCVCGSDSGCVRHSLTILISLMVAMLRTNILTRTMAGPSVVSK